VRWSARPHRAARFGRLLRDQREARGPWSFRGREKACAFVISISRPSKKVASTSCPAAAYIPAFPGRAYAAHVGLDPEKVMTAYHLSGPVSDQASLLPCRPTSRSSRGRAPIGFGRADRCCWSSARVTPPWHYSAARAGGRCRKRCRRCLIACWRRVLRPQRRPMRRRLPPGLRLLRQTAAAPALPASEVRSAPPVLPAEAWPVRA